MIKGLMLEVGFAGGEIGDVLNQWEELGIFTYALPFLLIFAMVFGVLTQSKIFKENKGINAIISLVVALMALQFEFVPRFFAEFFPRIGVGITLILGALILLGLFMGSKLGQWVMFGLAAIVFIVVVFQSFGDLGTTGGDFLIENWPTLLISALVIAAVIAIPASMGPKEKKPFDASLFAKAIGGD